MENKRAARSPLAQGGGITDLAKDCSAGFLRCESNPRLLAAVRRLEEVRQRFDAWLSYLGVFAPDHASLEYRLRFSDEIRAMVTDLLVLIQRNLNSLLALEPEDLSEPLESLRGGVERLHRLGVAIRKSSTTSLASRIKSFSDRDDEEYFFSLALEIVKWKFPDAEIALCRHLAAGIKFRRQAIRYQRRHEKKLQSRSESRQTEAAGSSTQLSQPEPAKPYSAASPSNQPSKQIPAPSQTNASTFLMKEFQKHFKEPQSDTSAPPKPKSTPSVISRGSTVVDSGVLPFPKPPEVQSGKYALCDWCFQEHHFKKYEDDAWWKRHVLVTLKPYPCLSEECRDPPLLFSTESEWRDHSHSSHGVRWLEEIYPPNQWFCDIGHPTLYFAKEKELENHSKDTHSDIFDGTQLPAVLEQSCLPSRREPHVCPLCDAIPEKVKQFQRINSSVLKGAEEIGSISSAIPMPSSRKVKIDLNGDDTFSENLTQVTPPNAQRSVSSCTLAVEKHVADHLRSLAFISIRNLVEEDDTSSNASAHVIGDRESLNSGNETRGERHTRSELVFEDIPPEERDLNAGLPEFDFKDNLLLDRLGSRFERTGSLDDLNRAVDIANMAVDVTPQDHPDRANRLSNLGFGGQITLGDNSILYQGNHTIYSFSPDDRCLADLYSTDPRHDKMRIERAKGGLLEDSWRWVLSNPEFQQWRNSDNNRLLWIKGDPGKGKTMLLCGIIDALQKSLPSGLLSYFFCQATDSRINNATAVLRGIIYLLISQQPALLSHVRRHYDPAGKKIFEDTNAWVVLREIFTSIMQDPILKPKSTYLIVDALDECTTDLPRLLELVTQISYASFPVKWIVSSRNWPQIEEQLAIATQNARLSLELNAESIAVAVNAYIRHKVSQLSKQKQYDNETKTAVQDYLSSNADGTFLWVALVCQALADPEVHGWDALKTLQTFPPGLDSLYARMIGKIQGSKTTKICGGILAVSAVVRRPVNLDEMTSLIQMPDGISDKQKVLIKIISLCGSFLTIQERTVYFVHQSAKDFLLGKVSREVSEDAFKFSQDAFKWAFPSGKEEVNYTILSRSLDAMSTILRRDMYDLSNPGLTIYQVPVPDPDPLAPVRYSCVYWIDHLCDLVSSTNTKQDVLQEDGVIHTFFKTKYLYWLEALSLLRAMSDGIKAVGQLQGLLRRTNRPQLTAIIQDAYRFALAYGGIIEQAPLQTYASALIFAPTSSLAKENFKQEGYLDSLVKDQL